MSVFAYLLLPFIIVICSRVLAIVLVCSARMLVLDILAFESYSFSSAKDLCLLLTILCFF